MDIEDILDLIDETLEDTVALPLSKKRVVDVELLHDYIQDIRAGLPIEMRQARSIVRDRGKIVEDAKAEASAIIKKAEIKASDLVNEQQIVKDASKRAVEILHAANQQSKDVKKSTENYCDKILRDVERHMIKSTEELKTIRNALNRKQLTRKP